MDFQSEKSFGKLRLRTFQPPHQILCMLKHVEDVEDYLRHLRHALIYIGFDGVVGKPLVSAFWNFFRIENPLSIKEVMSQNVCVCSFPIFDIHSLTPLMCTLSIFDIFHIALIFCTVFNAFNAMYLNTSNIKQCALEHIGMRPLMYTQQIRWQWVWMSGFLTISFKVGLTVIQTLIWSEL